MMVFIKLLSLLSRMGRSSLKSSSERCLSRLAAILMRNCNVLLVLLSSSDYYYFFLSNLVIFGSCVFNDTTAARLSCYGDRWRVFNCAKWVFLFFYSRPGAFKLYDVDNDGYITREEMYNIVDAIYQMVVSRESCRLYT